VNWPSTRENFMDLSRYAPLALAALSLGCPATRPPITDKAYVGKPPLGEAIVFDTYPLLDLDGDLVPDSNWRWIDFPDSQCGDGTPTGLAIDYLPDGTDDLVVFFDGGGACWSYATCKTGILPIDFVTDKNFGVEKFKEEARVYIPSSITDRAHLPPSLAGATLVFVPYCTGDVHAGDWGKSYSNPADTVYWQHRGHANVMAFLKRLGATFPNVRRLVAAGSSAGGFGALVNYPALRWYWPHADGFLIDDSGPALVGDDVPVSLREAWYDSWHAGVSIDPICVDCYDDLSLAWTTLAAQFPDDRLAFVTHERDWLMSSLIADAGSVTDPGTILALKDNFQTNLAQLQSTVFAPTANARVFYDYGEDHMLLTPETTTVPSPDPTADFTASHDAASVDLQTWLEAMFTDADLSDDVGWATRMD
jgi:hypothetical protein